VSLPARQQRALVAIDQAIEARDPRLAGMFRIFTKLNADDDAPRHERLVRRSGPWVGLFHPGRAGAGAGSSRRSRLHASVSAVGSLALLACLMAIVAMFAVISFSTPGCPQPPRRHDVAVHRAAACKAPSLPGK
jgi:hypothetical protein